MADERDITDARQEELLDWYFGGGSLTTSATVDVSLWNGDPHAGGAEVSTSGTGYARRTVNNDGTFWTTGNAELKQSLTTVRFPAAGTASADWAGGASLDYMGLHGTGGTLWLRLRANGIGLAVLSGGFLEIATGGIRFDLAQEESGNINMWTPSFRIAFWDKIFGGESLTPPDELEFSLWAGHPLAGGVEASTAGTGYARLTKDNDNVTWAMGNLIKVTAIDLSFAAAGDLTGPLGEISHLGIHNKDTGDLIVVLQRPLGPVFVDAGDPVIFKAGAVKIGFWWNDTEVFYP